MNEDNLKQFLYILIVVRVTLPTFFCKPRNEQKSWSKVAPALSSTEMESSARPPQLKIHLNVLKCITSSLGKSKLRDCFKGRPNSSATFCPKFTLPCPRSWASQPNPFPWTRGPQAALPWVTQNSLSWRRSFPRPHTPPKYMCKSTLKPWLLPST